MESKNAEFIEERKFLSLLEVENLGYRRIFDRDKLVFYLNNSFLPRLASLFFANQLKMYEDFRLGKKVLEEPRKYFVTNVQAITYFETKKMYAQLKDHEKESWDNEILDFKHLQIFFDELSKTNDPFLFLQKKEYSGVIKPFRSDNFHSWVAELFHHYSTIDYRASKYSETYKTLLDDFEYAMEFELAEEKQGKMTPAPEWVDFPISYFVSEKFKNTYGAFPYDVQDKIYQEVKSYWDNLIHEGRDE